MTEVLLIVLILAVIISILLQIKSSKKIQQPDFTPLKSEFVNIDNSVQKLERSIKDEFSRNREEIGRNQKDQREELNSAFRNFGDSISNRLAEIAALQKGQLDSFAKQLTQLTQTIEQRLDKLIQSNSEEQREFQKKTDKSYQDVKNELSAILKDVTVSTEKMKSTIDDKLNYLTEQMSQNSKAIREELSKSLKSFEEQSASDNKMFNSQMKEKFDDLIKDQKEINTNIELRLERVRTTVEEKLTSIQEDNSKKLDAMRETVDEKLQSTLEKRLGDSFKLVSERLEQVHKGLGEMQSLASGVGDLKKVLSNVKTRGVLGEYQLANLLEQILTPDQYGKNVKTVPGSDAIVEYAVKLPGREDIDKTVWLPIDAKFPSEDFQALMSAYEAGDVAIIEERSKALVTRIKGCAKDIKEKYLAPPNTTDFGILFLPFEGLYAEVLRNVGLFETLQRDYKIIITGPTTLAALLNSLQMGFRTLAIERRSSEVWELLGAVKSEFGKFGEVLEKTQKKLQEASNVIEQAGVRSRAIERKLKDVQDLPQELATDQVSTDLFLNHNNETT